MKTAISMGLLAGFLFGLATPLSKLMLQSLNGFQLAGILYLGAALIFLPFFLRKGLRELLTWHTKKSRWPLAGIVLFGGTLGPLFLMFGLQSAKAMSVSIWLNLELVATAMLGVIIFKEHLERYTIIGILLTLSAGLLVALQDRTSGALSGFFVMIACICWGIDNHLTATMDGVSPQTTTFIKGLTGGGCNILIGLLYANSRFQWTQAGISLIIGMVSYGISIYLYVSAAQSLGATRSQILFSTTPFWGMLMAGLLLGESFSACTLLASILLVLGIIFSNISNHGHMHYHLGITHIHSHRHTDGHHQHIHTIDEEGHIRHSHMHTHVDESHIHKHAPDLHHHHTHKKYNNFSRRE